MSSTVKTLPFTFVYDRSLYAGGATFADLLDPLLKEVGGCHYNYSQNDLNSIRGVSFPTVPAGSTPREVREEDVSLIWGLSMRQRMTNWPKPTKYITVLRHPILRFISLVRSMVAYDQWGCFWESALWEGDNAFERLDHFVNRYMEHRSEWSRSAFTELMGRIDVGGLEWTAAPGVYHDSHDPLLEDDGVQKTISWMEENFSQVYILELQEEALFHFASTYGFPLENISFSNVVRHDFYKRWDEADIPRKTMMKMMKLLRREIEVYSYFRQKFEHAFAATMTPETVPAYLSGKMRSIILDDKMYRHFMARDPLYASALFYGDICDLDSVTQRVQDLRKTVLGRS